MRDTPLQWKKDRLWSCLVICWLVTVFSAFFGSCLLRISVPGLGHLYLFRLILPVTAILYLLWAVKNREPLWKSASALEKLCWLLSFSMLIYGALSLFRAMDFVFTFQRLFNLCFDLCFFLLMLRLCQNRAVFRWTLMTCGAAMLILCVMGLYEIPFGGIFDPEYDTFKRVFLFTRLCQYPKVTFGNTNDYAAALTLTGALFLLFSGYHWPRLRRPHFFLLTVGAGLLYFFAIACDARLVIGTLYLLFFAIALFLLIRDRKRLWIVAGILLCMCLSQFITQYRYIVPPIQQYLVELKEHTGSEPNAPGASDPQQKPSLSIGNPNKEALTDTFYTINEETGQRDLSGRSNGMRVLLILHAFRCFKDSKFLGVGLGNTEISAKALELDIFNIHCFIARIIGDFGIFVLIPLALIGLLLLQRLWRAVSLARRRKDAPLLAFSVLFFLVLCAYPLLSTISSDAQDLLPMWIYLAGIVCMSDRLRQDVSALSGEAS